MGCATIPNPPPSSVGAVVRSIPSTGPSVARKRVGAARHDACAVPADRDPLARIRLERLGRDESPIALEQRHVQARARLVIRTHHTALPPSFRPPARYASTPRITPPGLTGSGRLS